MPATVAAEPPAPDLSARVAANPDDTDARYALALAHQRAGDPASAGREFEILLARDPENVDWLLGRAQSLIALGRPAEAVPLLERARARAPAYEDIWRVELTALEALDDTARANDLLESASRQFPGSEWPVARRAALRESDLLRHGTRASLSSSYERLSESKGEWRALALDLDHPLRSSLRVLAGLHAEERFGDRDEQIAAGFVARFDKGWAAALTADVAPQATILPLSSFQLEVGRPITTNASLGLRARHAHHETVDVDVLAATAELGHGAYRFAYTLTATQPTDLDISFGHTLRVSCDYGLGSFVSLVLANGEEAETVAPGNVLVTRNKTIALVGVHWRSAAWGAAWEVAYNEQGDLYNRMGLRLGLEHRF
jgi:YaiO family outer membrane protein